MVVGALVTQSTSFAQSQCAITGPSSTCGVPVQLCGPVGDFEYQWTGPNMFQASTQCISVSEPGTYTLRLFDMNNGLWEAPCSHTLASGTSGSCQISGPTTGCSGSPVELCGPDGNLTYAWSGPGGFSASTRCVSVTQSGTYSLVVASGGCASAPCLQSVQFSECRQFMNCPRTAKFWRRQCGGRGPAPLTRDQLSAVAGWVDNRSRAFDWQDDLSGFRRVLQPASGHDYARDRARRQFAAVLANVAANSLGLRTPQGQGFGLDPATQVGGSNGSFTLGSWIDQTDARLAALAGRSTRHREVRQAYKAIASVAWAINHGRGMGAVCRPQPQAVAADELQDNEDVSSVSDD
jgi:hypothetical protein